MTWFSSLLTWRHRNKLAQLERFSRDAKTFAEELVLAQECLSYLGLTGVTQYRPQSWASMQIVAPHTHIDQTIEQYAIWLFALSREQPLPHTPQETLPTTLLQYLRPSDGQFGDSAAAYKRWFTTTGELLDILTHTQVRDELRDQIHARQLKPHLEALNACLLSMAKHKPYL